MNQFPISTALGVIIGNSAVISPCGRYRYLLTRRWAIGPTCLFAMLNPSTADAEVNDPTVLRCIHFAKREGCGGLEIVNQYGYRSSEPRMLARAEDPVGPENDAHILAAADRRPLLTVAAWGASAPKGLTPRAAEVLAMLGRAGAQVMCLGQNADGSPRHPMSRGRSRVPDDAALVVLHGERDWK